MTQKRKARMFPAAIPLRTTDDDVRRKTDAIDLSVMPSDLSSPITGMLRKSIISNAEIMLNPATMVIRIRTKSTLKSIRSSQEKISGYMFNAEEATTVSSSSGVLKSTLAPTSCVISRIMSRDRYLSFSWISIAETSLLCHPLSRCKSESPA